MDGVKGKVIDAMSKGMPIIATSCALEGIEGIDEILKPYDSASDFADEIIRIFHLTDNELEGLSVKFKKYILENYSKQKAEMLLKPFIKTVYYTVAGAFLVMGALLILVVVVSGFATLYALFSEGVPALLTAISAAVFAIVDTIEPN